MAPRQHWHHDISALGQPYITSSSDSCLFNNCDRHRLLIRGPRLVFLLPELTRAVLSPRSCNCNASPLNRTALFSCSVAVTQSRPCVISQRHCVIRQCRQRPSCASYGSRHQLQQEQLSSPNFRTSPSSHLIASLSASYTCVACKRMCCDGSIS